MLEEGRISGKQMVFLTIVIILSAGAASGPVLIYREAGRDSWLSVILLGFLGVAAGVVAAGLGMRFPNMNIVQYGELLAGRILGRAIVLLYIIFFLYANIIFIRDFSEILVTYFMPETPLLFFVVGLTTASAYIVRSGLEVLARMNVILTTAAVLLGLLMFSLSSPLLRIENFTPVLEDGIMPVLKGVFHIAPLFAETMSLLMIIPYLNRPQEAKRAILRGSAIAGLVELLAISIAVALLGERMARNLVPFLTIARQISISELIERVEPLFILAWMIVAVARISIFHFLTVLTISQWLNLKEYKALVLPAGVLTTVLSVVLWGSFVELFSHITKILPFAFLPLELGLPLLLLVTAHLRGKGGGG
ncbi:MAG: spore germination protein [Firmicutes bacterium]|nr:spore germination protein [Bacillota bacterium]